MAKTVFRRDRRQVDSALPPASAPIICGLELSDTTSDNTAVFLVIDLASGLAVPFDAAWRVGEVDWELVVEPTTVLSVALSNNGGSLEVTVTGTGSPFSQAELMRMPSWSETLRGPRGEWVMGIVAIPEFVP